MRLNIKIAKNGIKRHKNGISATLRRKFWCREMIGYDLDQTFEQLTDGLKG
jgi:hypothetical protein